MKNKIITTTKNIFSKRHGTTLIVFMLFLIILKQFIIPNEYYFETNTQENILRAIKIFGGDSMVLGILLIGFFINTNTSKKRIKIIILTIMTSIIGIFIIDIITLFYFQSRLSLQEIGGFFSKEHANLFIQSIAIITAITVTIGLIIYNIIKPRKKHIKNIHQIKFATIFFIISTIITTIGLFSQKESNLQDNILRSNIKQIFQKNTQEEQYREDLKGYEDYFITKKGKNKKENIIIIMGESFSTVDSERDGGLYNNFPFLDKIQAEGTTFTNAIAHGCTSETAHIGLLQGIEPWQNPIEKNNASYYKYQSPTESLPTFFTNLGYKSIFLSTVSLDFLNQRNFLQQIGFKNIIGEEVFEKEKKYVFNAAPDHILYQKALETIKENKENPLFLVMQTISSHRPYNTPFGTNKDSTFSYVDKNIYAFYQKLKSENFFENGILIIIGDHRKMESISSLEFKKYGMSSHSRIIGTIVGKNIKSNGYNNGLIQHTDIFYSLKEQFGSGKIIIPKSYNNIFIQNKKYQEKFYRPRAIRYCRFSEKNYVVIEEKNAYTLRPGQNKQIENYINAFKKYQYNNLVNTGIDSGFLNKEIYTNPILIAHRGSPLQTAENSLEGFKIAKNNGADGIELDVSSTKDGKIIVFHGPSMNTTTCNKKNKIYEYNFVDLQKKCKLKNGENITTLEEMLNTIQDRFNYIFIDIKIHEEKTAEQITLSIIDIIKKTGLQDKAILSSYNRKTNYLLGGHQGIISARDSFSTGDITTLANYSHQYFMTEKELFNIDMIKKLKEYNKSGVSYVINTTGDLQKALNMGIRILMTDNIPLLKKHIENTIVK